MTKKVALISGGTGFVGSHLAVKLFESGWKVHLLSRATCSGLFPSLIDVHQTDGRVDSLRKLIEEYQPSVIFHLASLFIAEHEPDDIASMINSNIEFGTNLLEAASLSGVKNVIAAGTSWQNFSGDSYNPVCLYAAMKQAFEDISKYYVEARGLNLITLKLFDTYGPKDERKKLFYAIKQSTKTGAPLLMSPGEQLLDMVYIDDVISAFEVAAARFDLMKSGESEDYVVSSGKLITLKKLVELISKFTDEKIDVVWGGRSYRAREVMIPWRGGRVLEGWSAKVELEEGLGKMFIKEG